MTQRNLLFVVGLSFNYPKLVCRIIFLFLLSFWSLLPESQFLQQCLKFDFLKNYSSQLKGFLAGARSFYGLLHPADLYSRLFIGLELFFQNFKLLQDQDVIVALFSAIMCPLQSSHVAKFSTLTRHVSRHCYFLDYIL